MRRLLVVAVCVLVMAGQGVSAQGFVAPQPETATPRASRPPQAASSPTRQRRAPTTVCEQMTKDWVDHRPIIDDPAGSGLVTPEQQGAAVAECQAEQARQPSNLRVAFIFARSLEVNGHGTRAVGLFQQLANGGYTPALTQLARAYYVGNGVPRDMFEACKRYVDAARSGDSWAYNGAADCLSFQDFTHDPKLACRYFQKAQASGTFQTSDLTRADYCQ